MNGTDGFLDIHDSHLRVLDGNIHAKSIILDQLDITSSNTTTSTVQFLNTNKAFKTTANIEVGNANLFVDTSTSNVGILTSTPTHTLDVRGTANVEVLRTTSNIEMNGGTFSLGGHMIPTTHEQYDIGTAEKKIRHLFLSDNSLWIGDKAKISYDNTGDKLTFHKRKASDTFIPAKIIELANASGQGLDTTIDIQNHILGKSYTPGNLGAMKLHHWLQYAKDFQSNIDLSDIFTSTESDYDSMSTAEGLENVPGASNGELYTTRKVRIGSSEAPTANLDIEGTLNVSGNTTTPFVTGLGHLATKTYTFDPTNNTSKYFLGWTEEEGMEIEIQDSGYNHGSLNHFYITFHWGIAPILSSAHISDNKKYNFYYTYKNSRLYLWFNETHATDVSYPNVTYTIRMKTLKNAINLTEPGSTDQYAGTTIGVSAASALTRLSMTNINTNVGIGTTTPGQKLSIYTGSTSTAALSFDRYATGNYRTDIYQNTYGPDFRVGYGSHAPATVLTLERFSDGSKLACVGDAINPILRLRTTKSGDAWGTTSSDQYGKLQWWGNDWEMNGGSGAQMAAITVGTTQQYPGAMQMRFFVGSPTFNNGNWNENYVGYLAHTDVSNITFTGQHRNFIDGIRATEYTDYEGLIVSANKNKYYDVDKNVTTGVNAIKISQSLPLVSLSTKEKDKACFGVISGSEDPDTREYSQGSYVSVCEKQNGDRRAFINSVGEGAIWVTNINGPLESGDYITTSNVAGYGQKQDSDSLKNYTVAKITMDCDFEPVTQPVQIIKKEIGDVNYWVKTTYESITEEEYSNLTDEKRRIVEGDYQKIAIEESKTEQEGYELQVRQELVNILDEHGQIQWEDDPSGATEKAYKIRYLDADGNITDEANAVHKAAFVGCTYHCG